MSEEASETVERDPNKKKRGKKRKNFLMNARKYGKKGQTGRGTKISEETYQYFVGILEAIKAGVEDKDEKQALVNNVLERTKGEELNIIGNQLGCRVIELLVPFSSPEDLERYMEIISEELRRLCSDNFTSHVVETLLRVACERATEYLQTGDENEEVPKKKVKKDTEESKYTTEHVQKCHEFTVKICKYALNNLEDFVWDPYANHILRTALKSLSGITLLPGEKPKVNLFKEKPEGTKGIPPHLTKMEYKNVPEEFKDIAKEFANRLSVWPQFKDLPYQNITSGLLQVLLHAMKNVDKNLTRDLIKKLLNESFAPDDWVKEGGDDEKKDEKLDIGEEQKYDVTAKMNLPPVFESESAVRLLEAAIFVAKKKMYTQIYAKCFINRLGQLATMPMLNFTVQRLVDNCTVKEEFEPIFDELAEKFEALLACGNTGVLVALAKACVRLQARQAQFINKLESAFKCSEAAQQKYFPVCCLRMLPVDRLDKDKFFINIHGSIVLQTLMDFQRPAKAVNGLLELTSEELTVIFCDPKGSHVADAMCRSQSVGVKARDKLVWKLKGDYQKLVLSQHGSRAFEQIFAVASMEQKIKIMTEISEKSSLLNSTQYGRLVADKLDITTFKLSQKKWEDAWKKKNTNK